MSRTVVIVEDEDNAAPLEIALSSLPGVAVQLCPNGRDALLFLNSNSVTLDVAAVVTDLNLPHIDGFALVRAIRSHERYRTLPIVVISGNANPDTPGLVRQVGANAFFAKPYSPAEIRHTLEKLLYAH
jgi:CheY-like chemotaxis protein